MDHNMKNQKIVLTSFYLVLTILTCSTTISPVAPKCLKFSNNRHISHRLICGNTVSTLTIVKHLFKYAFIFIDLVFPAFTPKHFHYTTKIASTWFVSPGIFITHMQIMQKKASSLHLFRLPVAFVMPFDFGVIEFSTGPCIDGVELWFVDEWILWSSRTDDSQPL